MEKKKNNNHLFNFFLIIVIYSLIMTFFSSSGSERGILFKDLILIPIIGQMLHFYMTHKYGNLVKKIIEIMSLGIYKK